MKLQFQMALRFLHSSETFITLEDYLAGCDCILFPQAPPESTSSPRESNRLGAPDEARLAGLEVLGEDGVDLQGPLPKKRDLYSLTPDTPESLENAESLEDMGAYAEAGVEAEAMDSKSRFEAMDLMKTGVCSQSLSEKFLYVL
jgi:hypothetical protein